MEERGRCRRKREGNNMEIYIMEINMIRNFGKSVARRRVKVTKVQGEGSKKPSL